MATIWQTVATYLTKPVKPDEMLFGKRSSGPLTMSQLSSLLGWGATTDAGTVVNHDTATTISAVWCALKNITGAVGVIPFILYKRTGEKSAERFFDHPLYRILHDRPNPDMSAYTFWSTIESHVLLWGNGYAEIQRDQSGRVRALQLLTPDRVAPKFDGQNRLTYQVSNPSGRASTLAREDMLHLRGMSSDGIIGLSVIGRARQSLGLTLAQEKFGSTLFGNGPKWSGILQHPKTMLQKSKDALRADLATLKPGDYPMFEEGIEWKQIGMPAEDAEFLGQRKYQVAEVARWFNIPPHKLKDLDRATFSNIEEQGLDYLTDTIHPELVNIAQEVNYKLIAPSEYRIQFAEHLPNARLWTKTEERNRSYSLGIQWGWLNVNEVRGYENLNPVPNGDTFLIPANMVPADKMDAVIDAQIAEPDAADPAMSLNSLRMLVSHMADDIKGAILRALPLPTPPLPTIDAEQVRVVVVEALAALPPPPTPEPLPPGLDAETVRQIVEASLAAVQPPLPTIDAEQVRVVVSEALAALPVPPIPEPPPPGLDAETVRGVVAEALAAVPPPPPLPPMVDAETVRQIVGESVSAAVEEIMRERPAEPTPEPPAPDPEPPPDEPVPPDDNGAAARYHADLVMSQREIVAGVVRRMQDRERTKALAAATNPERLRAWIGDFYPKFAVVFQAQLQPAIRMHLAVMRLDADAEAATRALVEEYIDESKRQLHAFLDAQPADLAAVHVTEAVRQFCESWAITRASEIPDRVMREEMASHG